MDNPETTIYERTAEDEQALFDLTKDQRYWPALYRFIATGKALAIRRALNISATETEWRQSQGELSAIEGIMSLPETTALWKEQAGGKTRHKDGDSNA